MMESDKPDMDDITITTLHTEIDTPDEPTLVEARFCEIEVREDRENARALPGNEHIGNENIEDFTDEAEELVEDDIPDRTEQLDMAGIELEPDEPTTSTTVARNSGHLDADYLIDTLYTELRNLARARINRLKPGQTLQPTELVHEAYLRLQARQIQWNGRSHFFAVAAKVMRNIVVDHARQRGAQKRGGDRIRVDFTINLPEGETPMDSDEVLLLHDALERMQKDYGSYAELVLMHYFCGLTQQQIADMTRTPLRTVQRKMRFARAWLQDYFAANDHTGVTRT